jgi:hypothetical protein
MDVFQQFNASTIQRERSETSTVRRHAQRDPQQFILASTKTNRHAVVR